MSLVGLSVETSPHAHSSSAVYEDIYSIPGRETDQFCFEQDHQTIKIEPNYPLGTSSQITPSPTGQIAKWAMAGYQRLAEIGVLADDWDGEGAEAPTGSVLKIAGSILDLLSKHALQPDCIEASVEGGILFAFRNQNLYCDIECFNSGEVVAVKSRNAADVTAWDLFDIPRDIESAITEFKHFLNR